MSKLRDYICISLALFLVVSHANSEERTPIKHYITNGFPASVSNSMLEADLPHLLSGGDAAVYFNLHPSELLRTAVLPRQVPTMELGKKMMPQVGEIKVETEHFGTLTLDQFLKRPDSYAQGYLVVHKGNIVYESYPGMRESDHHVWMSSAKPTASLLIELLIEEGRLDDSLPVSKYVPEFRGTVWDKISVNNVLNMAAGTNTEENTETRSDPDSIATRVFLAEFGMEYRGKVESLVDVLKDAKAIEPPGEKFEYGSPLTQVLVLIVESIEKKRWHAVFNERVWSKVGSEGPFLAHTTPDGITVAHGLVSTRLRDKARFGMLYTPSWKKISTEQIVTTKILDRIHSDVQTHEFMMRGFDGPAFASFVGESKNPSFIANSRQWDLLWPDGDMVKFGLMTQGLYVSPARDLVIVYYSTNNDDHSGHRFARKIATSGLFDS